MVLEASQDVRHPKDRALAKEDHLQEDQEDQLSEGQLLEADTKDRQGQGQTNGSQETLQSS